LRDPQPRTAARGAKVKALVRYRTDESEYEAPEGSEQPRGASFGSTPANNQSQHAHLSLQTRRLFGYAPCALVSDLLKSKN
jgi:hypothetical protein